jgi:hypothetical protein
MTDALHDLQTAPQSPSDVLHWEELTPGNWRLSMGSLGALIVLSDGQWLHTRSGEVTNHGKAEGIAEAKQEAVLHMKLVLLTMIDMLERVKD